MSGRGFLPGLIRPVHADAAAWNQTTPVPAQFPQTTPVPAQFPQTIPVPAQYPQTSIPPPGMPGPSAPRYMMPAPGMAFPTQLGPYPPSYMGTPGMNQTRFPPPVGAYPMGGPHLFPGVVTPVSAAPLFKPVVVGDDDDFDDREISSDGTIAEQLFPPGRIADLDKAIAVSAEKSFIGKFDLYFERAFF